TMRSVVESTPISPEQLNSTLPALLVDAVLKALTKEPERRFGTCAQFLAALEDAKQELAPRRGVEVIGETSPSGLLDEIIAGRRFDVGASFLEWLRGAPEDQIHEARRKLESAIGVTPPEQAEALKALLQMIHG